MPSRSDELVHTLTIERIPDLVFTGAVLVPRCERHRGGPSDVGDLRLVEARSGELELCGRDDLLAVHVAACIANIRNFHESCATTWDHLSAEGLTFES